MSFADFFQATTGNLSYDYQSRLAGAIPVRNAILDGRPCAVAGEAAASYLAGGLSTEDELVEYISGIGESGPVEERSWWSVAILAPFWSDHSNRRSASELSRFHVSTGGYGSILERKS